MCDIAGELFDIKKRAVDCKSSDAAGDECRNLRGLVERIGIVQARATMDIGANGKDFAVDIFEREALVS